MNHCIVQDGLQWNIIPRHHLIVRVTVSDEVSKLHFIIFLTTPSAKCVDSGCWGSRHWFRRLRGLLCGLWKTKVGCGWENQTMMQIWNLWRTGKPGELWSMGMQSWTRLRNWTTNHWKWRKDSTKANSGKKEQSVSGAPFLALPIMALVYSITLVKEKFLLYRWRWWLLKQFVRGSVCTY